MLNGLPKKLNYNHQDITQESLIAKTFYDVFVNAGLNLASKLKHSDFNKEKYLTPSKSIMENAELTEKELLDAVLSLKLNKSQGFDNISSNVIIKCIFYIKKILLHIFNLSSKACSPTIKNIASYEAAEDIDFGVECTISNSPFHNSSLEAYSPTIKNIASDNKAVEDLNIDFGVENAISNSPFHNSSLEVHACSSIEKDTDLDEEETNSKDFDKKEIHPEKLVHLSKMSNTKVKSMKKKTRQNLYILQQNSIEINKTYNFKT
nr:uncharacterized protein LOC124816233 [Hydra vulgaris]